MSTIRASEIGTYLFCQRAWWYQKKGYTPSNQNELASGTRIHVHHTRQVLLSGCLRTLAYLTFLIAIILFAIYLTGKLI
ncbi:MAG: hypothetical protein JSV42_09620 [Chloroflexota bacterium]|nr:MAG: hypothetical protein JSV42_09620 [Chloroflexota bacterium]